MSINNDDAGSRIYDAVPIPDAGLSIPGPFTLEVETLMAKTSGSGVTVTVDGTAPDEADPVPLGVAGSWALSFRDEFDGTTVDTTKWFLGGSVEDPGNVFDYGNWVPDPDAAHVSVADSILTLSVTAASPKPHGGAIASLGKAPYFGYGYTEIRCRCPGTGGWPAVWMTTQLAVKEIDIAEGSAWVSQPSTIIHAVHTSYEPPVSEEFAGTSDGANWHVYGINWQVGSIDFYIDGVLSASASPSFTFTPEDHYALLTNASNIVAGTGDTGTFEIDYWRYWTGS